MTVLIWIGVVILVGFIIAIWWANERDIRKKRRF